MVHDTAVAAVTNFTGEFADANWTKGIQIFGCGSSSITTTGTTSVALQTAQGCANIGATYTHENGGAGATRAGTASFSYDVTQNQPHTYSAVVGISGGSSTTLATSSPASGSTSIAVNAGEKIYFNIQKSSGAGTTTFTVSSFAYYFAPDAPSIGTATAGNASATVAFTAASSVTQTGFSANWNAASGATGYRLDVATDSGFTSYASGYQNKDVGNVTTSSVTGLSGGTTYYYRVRAYNTGGTSGNSNIITATTLTLPTKVDLTGPSTLNTGAISTAFTLTSQDSSGTTANVTQDTVFNLTSNTSGKGTFYSDAGGTSVITQVTISNGSSSATFYYKDTNTGTPTVTATRTTGMSLGSDTLQITVSLATPTLATTTPASYDCSVTKVEMHNGTSWVTLFTGTAALDVVPGGTFPGVSDLSLPAGTYSQIKVTFTNSFPLKGSRSYGGATYYTTAATFGGQTNLASTSTTAAGSMAEYTFRIEVWGAINDEITQTFSITPVTVGPSTDYQPILRVTISDKLELKGAPGTPSTYYFALSVPTVSIVAP